MVKEYSYWIIPIHKDIEWNIEVLIIKSKLRWHRWFPKWHKKKLEKPIETAMRELFEETWIKINNIDTQTVKQIYKDKYKVQKQWKSIEKYVWYFIYYTQSKEVKIQKNEIMDFLRLPIDKVEEKITHESLKIIFQEAKKAILNS